jgi:regulator of replication initiation timing
MKSSSILLDVILESDKTPLVLRLIAYIESLEEKFDAMGQTVTQLNQAISIHAQVMEAYQTRIQELEEKNEQLIIENKTLKNLPQKPKTTPSTMDKDKDDKSDNDKGSSNANVDKDGNPIKKNKNNKTRSKNKNLVIHETKIITIDNLPEGAFIKDYQTTIIQDIKFEIHNVELKLARYQLPDGTCITAEKPSYYQGQFGPTLKSFIDLLHYDGRVTQGRIYNLLMSIGVDLSTGQISHLLNHNRDEFHNEKADLLTTGLARSDYIQVDDTQAKHNGNSGYCLFIGNPHFSFFASTDSKSRLNFLSCLNQKSMSFVLNEEALAYCAHHKLPQKYHDLLDWGTFDDLDAYLDYIESLGLTSEHYMRLMTEAALLGSCYDKGY